MIEITNFKLCTFLLCAITYKTKTKQTKGKKNLQQFINQM